MKKTGRGKTRRNEVAAEFRAMTERVNHARDCVTALISTGDRKHVAARSLTKFARRQAGEIRRWLLEFGTHKRECERMLRGLVKSMKRLRTFLD